MKKISLKLTQSQTEVLVAYSSVADITPCSREEEVQLSIQKEVYEKAWRFCFNFSSKNKPRKLTLKLYEADVLERFLSERTPYTLNNYHKNTLQYIIGEINQQLA